MKKRTMKLIKKHKRETIYAMMELFSPLSESITEESVENIYDRCLAFALLDGTLYSDATSMAEKMVAQYIGEYIQKEAISAQEESCC